MAKQVSPIAAVLQTLARPLVGRGIIDRHAHFLIPIYQKLYSKFQTQQTAIVSIPLGKKLTVLTHDVGIGLPLMTRGAYEPTETTLFLDIVKTGDTVIDIGANVGYYSVLASELVGSHGRVIAFEADQDTLPILHKNLELNQLSNVTVEEKAVSHKNAPVMFAASTNAGESGIAYKNDQEQYKVDGVTLDSYAESHKIKTIDVIKMDIEGAETFVLKGASCLKKMKGVKLFIEYNPEGLARYMKDPHQLLSHIEELGFKIESIIDERDGQVIDYSEKNFEAVMSRVTYCNLFCVK